VRRLLIDTGPLVAILDAGDAAHAVCVEVLSRERGQLVTTWPVVTEAMYLLGSSLKGQQALLAMCDSGSVEISDIREDIGRVSALMERYRDVPMDFADASQVAVAERERLDVVFTLDNDFRIYRIGGRQAFHVIP
jgi:uncharacterized protein